MLRTRALSYLLFVLIILLFQGASLLAQVPVVTGVIPNVARQGDTITINGANFNAVPANNIVYFGAVKGVVSTATTTQLKVIVDTGAIFGPISVLNMANGLTGLQNPERFLPTFRSDYFITDTITIRNRTVLPMPGTQPFITVPGDIDGDGRPDLVTNCKATGQVAVIRNLSSGSWISGSSFSSVQYFTCGNQPTNVKLVDIDGDGMLDVLATQLGVLKISILRNTSSPGMISFASNYEYSIAPTGVAPYVIGTADFNRDGLIDIAVTCRDSNYVVVLQNNSSAGTLDFSVVGSYRTNSQPHGLCTADFDNDGFVDIVTADTQGHALSIFKNTSSSSTISFADNVTVSVSGNPIDVQAADIDNDGRQDIVISQTGLNKITLFKNISTAGFIDTNSFAPGVDFLAGTYTAGLGIGDLNGDGKPDIVVANAGSGGHFSMFINHATSSDTFSTSTLSTPIDYNTFGIIYSTNVGDLNGDGYPEIIATNNGGGVNILRNYPIPPIDTITGPRIVCASSIPVTYTNTVTGGIWKSSNPALAAIDSVTGVLTPISAGTVTITYFTVAGGDSNSRRLTVTLDPIPSVSAVGGPTTVCAGASITLTNTVSGGTWSISDPTVATIGSLISGTTVTLTGLALGPETVSYSFTNSCGTDTKTKVVAVNAPPSPGFITGNHSMCGADTTTLISTASGGIWSSSASAVATVNSSGKVFGVTPGVTTISYTVSNTCGPSSATFSFTVNVAAFAGTISGPSTVCEGAIATLTNAAPDGVWTSSDPAKATVSSTGVVTGVSAGAVTIKYKVTNSCNSDSTTWPMTVNQSPVSGTISGLTSVCATTTITLTTTGTGGTWSSSASSIASVNSSGGVRGNSAGTAIISYSVGSAFCGTAVDTQMITVNPQPVPGTITGLSRFVCAGLTLSLGNTITTGTWSSGAPAIATVSNAGLVTALSAGTTIISYSVTNICGTLSDTQMIRVNPQPDAGTITGFNSICEGQTQSLTNTVTTGTWSTGAASVASISATGAVSALAPGTAIITYTFTNVCGTATDTQSLTVNPLPVTGTITGSSRFVCAGVTLSLNNTVTTGTWSSSNTVVATVNSSGIVNAISAGVAVISYSVTNGCGTLSDTQAIRVNPQPDAGTINGGHVVCQGQNLTLSNAATGGAWSSSVLSVASVNAGGVVHGIAGGNTIISYTVTNSCNTAVDTQMVTVNPLPVVNVTTGPTTVCVGADITLANTTPGGVWGTSAFARATVTAGVVTGVSAGEVIISYTVTNGCGPTADTILITILAQPVSGTITGPNSLCTGTNITLGGAATGGTWSSSDNSVATVAGGTVYGVAVGTAIITYNVTNSCNTVVDTQLVNVQLSPDAGHINGPTAVCAGGAMITLSNAATSGTWSSSNTSRATVSDGVVTGVAAGNVIISYTTVNSCGTATDTQMIVVNPLPVAGTIAGASLVCSGGADITLTASLPGGIWGATNGNATVAGGVVHGVTAGVDTITYSKTNSCGTDIATKIITVELTPVAGSISGASSVCAGQSVTLNETVTGGTWSVSNTRASVADSVVTGISQGSVTISYSVTNSCGTVHAVHPMTIDTLPPAGVLTGPPSVCTGTDITLIASISGGVWSATNANATVAGGIVSGITLGTDTIVYTTTNICGTNSAFKTIIINNSPYVDTIGGVTIVCEAAMITLTNTISGGVWISADTAIAHVNDAGGVTGVAGGAVAISYAVTTVCGTATEVKNVTVNPLPRAGIITGPANVCIGFSITLSDTATGGVWSATNTNATVAGGVVTGALAGVDTIVYTVTNSCGIATTAHLVTIDPLSDTGVITGAPMVCLGSAISLSNTVAGGMWSSSAPLVAMVSASGVVTGLSEGDAIIMYTPGTGCNTIAAHHAVAVHGVPTLISPLTAPAICDSTAFNYTAASNVPAANMLWQRSVIAGIANGANSGSGNVSEVLDNTTPYPITVVYTYTVSAAGCADTVDVSVTVKPTPKLAGNIDLATCGAIWFDYTPASLTPGAVFAWTRPAVTGISPATSSGTGTVHDSVVNTLGGSLTATYLFTLTAAGCTGVEEVHVILSEGAHQPHITTHPPSVLCAATQFQNFGTTDTTYAGETFSWSTSGSAALWAAGVTGQYSLVNFTTTGLGWVCLQNTQTSSGCALRDSFAVYITSAANEHPTVTRFGSDFVCEASDEEHYQWGYDDALTLDSVLLAGETNQNYYNASPDYAGKHYWVMTTRLGCMQKSYYNAPAVIHNVAENDMVLNVHPNPTSGIFEVVVTEGHVQPVVFTLTDLLGHIIQQWSSVTDKLETVTTDTPSGVYLLSAATGDVKYTARVIINR
jgi:uncharacterized protein YjdB